MHIRHLLRHRGRLAAAATAAVLPVSLAWAGMATAGTTPQPSQLPQIKHVWVIELENEGLGQSFGDRAADPYLAVTLRHMGGLLQNYYAVGHDSLDNYVARVSARRGMAGAARTAPAGPGCPGPARDRPGTRRAAGRT